MDWSRIMSYVGFCYYKCYIFRFCFHDADLCASFDCFLPLVLTNEITQKEKCDENISWFALKFCHFTDAEDFRETQETALRTVCGRGKSLVTPEYRSLSLPICVVILSGKRQFWLWLKFLTAITTNMFRALMSIWRVLHCSCYLHAAPTRFTQRNARVWTDYDAPQLGLGPT
jgi:hypothetical protein